MITRLLWATLTGIVLFSAPTPSPGQARIVGGVKAPSNSYRWIVALAESDGGSLFDRQFCGASLISRDWVLTAAHCVEDEVASRIQVVVGLSDLEDTSSAQIRGVRGIYMHPAYSDLQGDLVNDIALLLLDAPVTNITPVGFARSPSTAIPGMSVRALGWGDTLANPRYPTELRMVDLDVVSIDFANRAYGSSRFDSRHLAAMAPGKDTCSGDSGGPLFDIDGGPGGTPLLLGITSFGLDCAQRGVPGIYANVGNFASWIDGFLAFNSSAADPSMELRGNNQVIPSGSAFPKAANLTDFGRPLSAGRSRVRRFVVSNDLGGIPLSISGVRFSNRAFTAISYPRYLFGGSSGLVSVRYRAPSSWRSGRSQARMYILNNDPANPFYAVNLRARYRPDWW
jgi:secreted trypsin-like serine protease